MGYVILALVGLDLLIVFSCCKMGSIQSGMEERYAERQAENESEDEED